MNKKWNGSIWRYILSFSSVIILVILVMGIYLYRYYYVTIYDYFKTSNQAYLNAVMEKHENDMNVINDIVTQIGLSDTITPFRLEDQPLKSILIEKQLFLYKSVSQSFSQIYLFYHEDDYLYNAYTSFQIDRFVNSGFLLEYVTSEELLALLYSDENGMLVVAEQEMSGFMNKYADFERKGIMLFLPINTRSTGTIAFQIGSAYYDELLESDKDELRQTFILYGNEIIAWRGTSDYKMSNEVLQTMEHDSGSYTIINDNKRYLITYQAGASGFLYCTVQNEYIFQDKVRSEQWPLLFIIFICCITGVFGIFRSSKGIISRIGNINALLDDEKNRKDFSDIEVGIIGLKKRNNELSQESVPLQKAMLIRDLISNDYESIDRVIAEGKQLGIDFNKKQFIAVLVGSREDNFENRAMHWMLEQLSGDDKVSGYGVKLLAKNQNLFIILGDEIEQIESILRKCELSQKDPLDNLLIAVSNYHTDLKEAPLAYLEADTVFDNRFLQANSEILRFSDALKNESIKPLPNIYLNSLRKGIYTGNEEGIHNAIEEICKYLQSGKQSLFAFRMICNDIIQLLIHEWNPHNIKFEYIYSVFTISQCLTMDDFSTILHDVCKLLVNGKQIDEGKESKMKLAIAYMQENYNDANLNMRALADILGMSSVALSVEFKDKMSISPSDYLTLIRIERSKELLKITELSVREISGAVGYDDPHVFMRRFKKLVGKTPTQYREDKIIDIESKNKQPLT